MKYIILFFLVILFSSAIAQERYVTINKETYDSLESHTWYWGRIFFMDGESVYGYIHRVPDQSYIEYKGYPKDTVKILTANSVQGYYNVHKKDTAWFIFFDIDPRDEKTVWIPLRILIDGSKYTEGISLMMNYWLVKEESRLGSLLRSNGYEIHWDYYLWKKGKIVRLDKNSDLVKLIRENPDAMSFYRENKRKLNRENDHYKILSEIINIYNKSSK